MTLRKVEILVFLALTLVIAVPARAVASVLEAPFQEADGHDAAQEADEHRQNAGAEHAAEEAELDVVHHNSDSIYLDFSPFAIVELL